MRRYCIARHQSILLANRLALTVISYVCFDVLNIFGDKFTSSDGIGL